jgi:Mn2+/Fe2+ NRAMP family transporter
MAKNELYSMCRSRVYSPGDTSFDPSVKECWNPAARKLSFWARLGSGLITGATDDVPSGIASYAQVGAGFGCGIQWTAFFTFPLMVGIRTVSDRIGRFAGQGHAANVRKHCPP